MFRLGSRWHPLANVDPADPTPAEIHEATQIRIKSAVAFLDRRLVELSKVGGNNEAINVCLDTLALLRPDGSR